MTLLGYLGLAAFALAWVPQTWESLRAGRCGANRSFLALSALGSFSLAAYAFSNSDVVFTVLNAFTGLGAAANLFVELRAPARRRAELPPARIFYKEAGR
jgi:lipid-A-disaccharide synthase-like uncharacterized protein